MPSSPWTWSRQVSPERESLGLLSFLPLKRFSRILWFLPQTLSDREAARRGPGARRLFAQRRAAGETVLDHFGLGGRGGVARLRRDAAARAGDAGRDTARAPDGVCAVDPDGFGVAANLGRRPAPG
jgi:hypothetical protein